MIGVPLATMPALLADWWWTLPPFALLAWWWAPRDDPWAWVVGAQAGILGTAWAVIGSTALAEFPDDRLFVGALWTASAGALAVAAMHSRRRGRSAY
jgi:hypothetical protein